MDKKFAKNDDLLFNNMNNGINDKPEIKY